MSRRGTPSVMTTTPTDPADVAPRRRHRSIRWIGAGLAFAGLVILGYVAWQLVATNIISERRQAALVEQLQTDWERPPGPDTTEPAQIGEASALVRIPRFGDDYVVPVVEGVGDGELASGFGHFEDSADPGQVGNFAVAAHRVTHGQPLREMPSLRPGDTVVVETRDAIYTYTLVNDPNDLVVDSQAGWVVAARPVNPQPDGVQPGPDRQLITLVTCAELFHTNDRMVAFGRLTATQPK
jgi:sortase A